MGNLHLDLAFGDYDRVRVLRDRSVQPEKIELNLIPFRRPEETFWRMLVHRELYASEMSFGGYVAARSRGDSPFIAIPRRSPRVRRLFGNYRSIEADDFRRGGNYTRDRTGREGAGLRAGGRPDGGAAGMATNRCRRRFPVPLKSRPAASSSGPSWTG
jgi:hypothetical protein